MRFWKLEARSKFNIEEEGEEVEEENDEDPKLESDAKDETDSREFPAD